MIRSRICDLCTWPELQRSIWDELLKLPQDLFESINASNHKVTIKARDRDGQWKLSKAE